MNTTEKKLNQILNFLNFIHNENTFFLNLIASTVTNEKDRNTVQDYLKKCNDAKMIILSGMYEDDIGIVD